MRRVLRHLWRLAVRTLPASYRDDLPGYPWLVVFVEQWAGCHPQQRQAMAYLLVDPRGRYRRAIERAGGVRAGFWTVWGENPVPDHWRSVEDPRPTVDTMVNVLLAILGTQGVRLEGPATVSSSEGV